jgi:hypothetical protein
LVSNQLLFGQFWVARIDSSAALTTAAGVMLNLSKSSVYCALAP